MTPSAVMRGTDQRLQKVIGITQSTHRGGRINVWPGLLDNINYSGAAPI